MAAARFQVFARSDVVSWRFLSANNRSIGRSVGDFPDGDTCLQAVRDLQRLLETGNVVTVRDEVGRWMWRLRIDRSDVAVSTRRYHRRLHAENAGSSFRDLAAAVGGMDGDRRLLADGTPMAIIAIPKLGLREVVGEGTHRKR